MAEIPLSAPPPKARAAANPLFGPSLARSKLDEKVLFRKVEIDASWTQWIAENRLRDCAPDSMVATMTAAGIDPTEARSALDAMERSPTFLAARRHQQLHRKLESMVGNMLKVQQLTQGGDNVEKRSGVSRDEFIERYAAGCSPVVLTDLARDWPAMQRWSPSYLKERFGGVDVEIQADRNADPKFEENKLEHRRTVRLADFVDMVVGGGATNDYYLTANNEVLRRPELAPLLEDIGSMPPFCRPADLARSASFWFGPAGTHTPLHHDTLMLLHTQVVGRKRWRFISPLDTPRVYNHNGVFSPIDIDVPDFARYPLFRDVKVHEVVVEPGETIFLPLAWWHQVSGLDISLSLSYTNIDVPNDYTFNNPSITEW
jgi:hypothetical protein